MTADDYRSELQAIAARAGVEEARRQAALQRGDCQAAADAEQELSRLWARYCDLEQQVA